MKPVFQAAKLAPKRVAYAEGEEDQILRAVQVVVDEGLARPVLVGRSEVIDARVQALGLRLKPGSDCDVVDPTRDTRTAELAIEYYELMKRQGVTAAIAREAVRTRATLLAAMLLRRGDVDAVLCGTVGTFHEHLQFLRDAIGPRPGVLALAAMNMLMLPN